MFTSFYLLLSVFTSFICFYLCLRLLSAYREETKPKRFNGIKLTREEEEEEEVETAPEKRLRLAKEYIAQVEEEGILLHR